MMRGTDRPQRCCLVGLADGTAAIGAWQQKGGNHLRDIPIRLPARSGGAAAPHERVVRSGKTIWQSVPAARSLLPLTRRQEREANGISASELGAEVYGSIGTAKKIRARCWRENRQWLSLSHAYRHNGEVRFQTVALIARNRTGQAVSPVRAFPPHPRRRSRLRQPSGGGRLLLIAVGNRRGAALLGHEHDRQPTLVLLSLRDPSAVRAPVRGSGHSYAFLFWLLGSLVRRPAG